MSNKTKCKKQHKDWYIAMTHYLTAGFAIPFVISVLTTPILTKLLASNGPVMYFANVIGIISVWLGVIYSASYINKTYIVKDKEKIAKLSTIFLIISTGSFMLINLLQDKTIGIDAISIVFFIVEVIVFYILSKKYIKETASKNVE